MRAPIHRQADLIRQENAVSDEQCLQPTNIPTFLWVSNLFSLNNHRQIRQDAGWLLRELRHRLFDAYKGALDAVLN